MTESLQEKADRLRLNASSDERLAIAAHELGHYEMAKRAGIQPEGITIGHHPTDGRSASVMFVNTEIDTGLTHDIDQWREKAFSIAPPERNTFMVQRLKAFYAGEAAEDIITDTESNSGRVDSELARRWMEALGWSATVMGKNEVELKRRVWEELSDPETKCRLTYAAQQLAEHHFDGKKHPPSTIEHYLKGGTRQNLPTEER